MSSTFDDRINQIIEEARTDNSGALAQASELIAQYPEEAEAWSLRAYVLARDDKYAEAIEDMAHALELAPSEPVYFFDRGRYYAELDDYQNAIDDFTRGLAACDLHSRDYYRQSFHFRRAYAHLKLGNKLVALEDLKCIHDEGYYVWIDTICTKNELLLIAQSADDQWASAHRSLSKVGKSQWPTVRRLNPEVEGRIKQITEQIRTDDPDALAKADELVAQFPDEPRILLLRSDVHAKSRKFEEAIEYLTLAIKRLPDESNLFFHRGKYYEKLGDYQNAIDDFTHGLAACDRNPIGCDREVLYFHRADAHIKLGNKLAALEDLKGVPEEYWSQTDMMRTGRELFLLATHADKQ